MFVERLNFVQDEGSERSGPVGGAAQRAPEKSHHVKDTCKKGLNRPF